MGQEVNCGQLYQLKRPPQFFVSDIDSFLKKKGSGLLSLQFSFKNKEKVTSRLGPKGTKKKYNLILNYLEEGKM